MHKDPGVAVLCVTALTPSCLRPFPGAPHSWQRCSQGPLPDSTAQLLASLTGSSTFWEGRWRVGNVLGLEREGHVLILQANPDRSPSKMTENKGPNQVLEASHRLVTCDQGLLLYTVVGRV